MPRMRRVVLSALLLLVALAIREEVLAQRQVLTLRQCQELARRNSPLAGQDTLVMALGFEQGKEVTLGYLPRLSLVAQGGYQSDVPHLDLPPLPFGLPMPHKDQQAFFLQAQLPLWDGGGNYSRRRILRAETDKRLWEARLGMEAIHKQVEHLYYSILLLDRQFAAQGVVLESLARNAGRIDTLIAHGVASRLDAQRIELERLRLQQDRDQLQHHRQGVLSALGVLLGVPIDLETQFAMPFPVDSRGLASADSIERMELRVHEADQRAVAAHLGGVAMTLTPKLFLYGQAGYAKPGPNIFNHKLAPYYYVGLQLRWDVDALYSYFAHRRALRMQQLMHGKSERAFRQGVLAQAEQLRHALQGLEASLKTDSAMLTRCEAIKEATELRLLQGDATAHDLLNSVSQWQSALEREALHRVQRAQILGQIEGTLKGWKYYE